MFLDDTDQYSLHRRSRHLWASFKTPHRVLSTCKVNGGLREDLTHVANHQSCEGVAHDRRYTRNRLELTGLSGFHAAACDEVGLPPSTTALMSTAANMQCAVLSTAVHDELRVAVAATAGVLGNATRAGDPAGWHEHREGSRPIERVAPGNQAPIQLNGAAEANAEPGAANADDQSASPHRVDAMCSALSWEQQRRSTRSLAGTPNAPDESGSGTIVTLVFINQPCTAACLTRAATMVTEGKSTALLDLRMPSLQSAGLATGTGTDQLVIAAPMPETEQDWERNWAGSHNSLGQLLARATHEAVTRCLLLQNGVCAELRRSICGALSRHGCDEAALLSAAPAILDESDAALFASNLTAIIHDPQSAAAAYALAEIIDLVEAGILHAEVAQESLINQAALLAAAVAVAPEQFATLRDALHQEPTRSHSELAARAVILGFANKWR
ncbi:adenosylcobinamide amidohydrolase [Halochromatium glycolicum]|uniref:Adenosylcobinamide amidohydrolase n=1 Tax=Halochromatium glycolicum TaxID=85075 RepID=A0AAJ0XBL3_9GAMM|nr:adenosylcobinamide amidohydrolase [Halochromatium glycolicum]MBK1706072.1 hypothetical protein [Halochromatium glycolicum]